MKTYGAHSTRAASTSAVFKNMCVNEILKKSAGWTNEKTFAKFYNLEINDVNFGNSVIDGRT